MKKDLMEIAFHFALPTFTAAKMSSKANSELLGDPNEKVGRGMGGAKASEIFIKVFPELIEALAFPKMELAMGLISTVRAQAGSCRVVIALLLHVSPVRQHLHALKSSPLLVPQFLHASMIGCSINDPAVAVKSSSCPDGMRQSRSDSIVSMASKMLFRAVKDVKADVWRAFDDELRCDAASDAMDSGDKQSNGPQVGTRVVP